MVLSLSPHTHTHTHTHIYLLCCTLWLWHVCGWRYLAFILIFRTSCFTFLWFIFLKCEIARTLSQNDNRQQSNQQTKSFNPFTINLKANKPGALLYHHMMLLMISQLVYHHQHVQCYRADGSKGQIRSVNLKRIREIMCVHYVD